MGGAARIGLTGGIGSGKSTVAALFAERGAAIVDSDAVAHELSGPGGAAIEALRAAFGADALDARGALDRARMRARILADPGERQRLEAVLHPLIVERCLALAGRAKAPLVVIEVALLAESPTLRTRLAVDAVLVVDCPAERQLAQALARGLIPEVQLRAIMAAQATRAQRLDIADDVLFNDGAVDEVRMRVARLWAKYSGARPV